MRPRVEIPIDELVRLIDEHKGNVSEIKRATGFARGTIQSRIDESATATKALNDARETFVDDVESALFNNALDGNVVAQIFIMKAHPAAKRRGWGERTELTGKDGGPVASETVIRFEWSDATDANNPDAPAA